MSLNRRQFLKNAGIGSAAVVGGASLLKTGSAFAATAAPTTSDVSFVGGTSSYTSTNSGKAGRRGMIYDALLPLQSAVAAGITGKNIVIKVNLVYTGSDTAHTILNCSHVDAVRGLIDFLRMISPNVPITIAEASGYSPLSGILNTCGYFSLLTDYTGITLVDLNNNKTVPSASGTGVTSNYPAVVRHLWKPDFTTTAEINASSAFLSPGNYVISLTRPKSHNCMVMTATVKNMCMGTPLTNAPSGSGNSKEQMHGDPTWYQGTHTNEDKCLAWNLYQIANIIKPLGYPNLAVLDAWEGEQHNGPTSGESIMQYCAVAGTDFLAVDRVSAKLMGFSDTPIMHQVAPYKTPSYTDMRALVWMSNAGLGNYDLSKINLLNGVTWSSITPYVKNYQLHDQYTATGTSSYETSWADSTNMDHGPTKLLDQTGVHDPVAKPFMAPQANFHTDGVVTGNHVHISFALPYGHAIDLGIYNLQGREIRRLGREYLNAGRYSIEWDCKDAHGAHVPNGNYLIKMNFGRGQMCDKITLLR